MLVRGTATWVSVMDSPGFSTSFQTMAAIFADSKVAYYGRIADILRTHHFRFGEELETTLLRFAWLYNHHLPQQALGHVSPV